MRGKKGVVFFLLFFDLIVMGVTTPPVIAITTPAVAGDGAVPTYMQWLSMGDMNPRMPVSDVGSNDLGDATTSFPFALPPSLLQPVLGIGYNSSGGMNLELSYGWGISGILYATKPRTRAYEDDVVLIVGGLFSGLLKLDDFDHVGERYVLTSTTPGYISADFDEAGDDDEDNDTLTIYANGITHTLTYKSGALAYRVDQSVDQHGNYITYTYWTDGRIRKIEYGGNTSGDAHNVSVQFTYADNTVTRVSYAGSTEANDYKTFAYHLTQVTIKTKIKPRDFQTRYSYVINYTTYDDALDLPTSLVWEGPTSATSRTLAAFEYSQFDETETPTRTSTNGIGLGAMRTVSELFGTIITSSQSRLDSGLGDLTGDGLADYLSSCEDPDWDQVCDETGTPWGVYSLDRDATTETFDHSSSARTVSVPNPGVMVRSFEGEFSTTNQMKTTQMIRDFDGDGRVDVIVAEGEGVFRVYQGLGTGFAYEGDFDDYIYEENGPSRSQAIQVDYTYNASYTVGNIGLYKGMFDINSDGFLDIVEPGRVYLHSGTLGEGWESRARSLSFVRTAIQTVEYTIDTFDYGTDTPDDDTDNLLTGYDYISEQKETANFYDLNSDGCLDYVMANPTYWQVYYGRCDGTFRSAVSWDAPGGYDFISHTMEGLPRYDYSWTDEYSMEQTRTYTGQPSRQIAALIDVNGDGRLDWAGGEEYNRQWWQNTGAGFIGPHSLPDWWPDEFSYSRASSTSSSTGARTSEGISSSSTESAMMDIDHDNAVDYVTAGGVTYGNYPRPYLLTSVTRETGGITEVSYVHSSQLYPAGAGITTPQYMPISKDVVEEIHIEDPHTGQTGQIQFDRENGVYENQVFEGFEDQTITTTINGISDSQTQISYQLSEDFPPLPTDKIIQSNYASTRASFADRYYIHTDYYASDLFKRLPHIREVTEYGETSGAKTYSLTFIYDDHGYLTYVRHDGGTSGSGSVNDSFQVDMNYISNSDDRFSVIYEKKVSGHDPLNGDIPRFFSYTQFDYDDLSWPEVDKGLLTSVRTCDNFYNEDGECGIYETTSFNYLSSSYAYSDRGELTSVTNDDTGETMTYTYGFNDSVLQTVTNSLSQTITNTIDSVGRITDTTDPNGFKQSTVYDDFNRTTELSTTDVDGSTNLIQSTVYDDATSPTSVTDSLYNGSVLESTQYVLFDGFGHPAQVWRQTYTGDYSVSNALFDVTGKSIQSGHPESYGVFASVPFTIGNIYQEVEYDSMGVAREIYSDRSYDSSILTTTSFAEPWQEITTDPSGYLKKLVFDAHGRVTEVWMGDDNSGYYLLAQYRYDPQNRLVKYTDPDGNFWNYYYDAAGRLRQVSYGDAATAETAWYTYTYENGRLKRIEDNTGAYSEITAYDAIGRMTDQEISDGLPTSTTGLLTYHWEYDGDWIGAVEQEEDPIGAVEYDYDNDGRLESATRTNTSGISAIFSYQYEDNGRLQSTTYPSGHILENNYDYGWLTQQIGKTDASTTDYTIDFTYNRWGQKDTATTDKSITYTYTRPSPIRLDNIVMERGRSTYRQDYVWASNGLLQTKSVQVRSTTSEYTYDYNPLKELEGVTKDGVIQESFIYDATGTLTDMTDADGVEWNYGRAGVMGQITDRTSSAGGTVSYMFESNGQVSSVEKSGSTREIYYDGLGRFRGAKRDGAWIEVVDYAANGSVTRRADDDPNTGSPNYTYSFGAWEFDSSSRTETDGPYVTYQGNNRIWKMTDYAGTVTVTLPETFSSTYNSMEYSAYGKELNITGTAWTREALHGARRDSYQDDLYEKGQRRMLEDDGQWLQPEPMLYTGLSQAAIIDPLKLQTYRYAANSPTYLTDPSGSLAFAIPAVPPAAVGAAILFIGGGYLVYDAGTNGPVTQTMNQMATNVSVGAHILLSQIQSMAGSEGENGGGQTQADATPRADPGAQVKANGERGRASQEKVTGEYDLPGDSRIVTAKDGVRTRPDIDTDHTMGDVKDTQKVSMTKQLKAQTEAATAEDKTKILITGKNTKVSEPVYDNFDVIIRRGDLGPQEQTIPPEDILTPPPETIPLNP